MRRWNSKLWVIRARCYSKIDCLVQSLSGGGTVSLDSHWTITGWEERAEVAGSWNREESKAQEVMRYLPRSSSAISGVARREREICGDHHRGAA